MRADRLAFVQFIHPGGEHRPDDGDIKRWNAGMHQRKFMTAEAEYLEDGIERRGRVTLWGEWEPPSRVIAAYPADGDLPRFVHEPFLQQPVTYSGLQNTDPYVFGPRFMYTGCQQFTNRGRSETQLRRLSRGSVVLFGSCRGQDRFVLDTVFVVADHRDHGYADRRDVLRGFVDRDYDDVTLGPWYADGDACLRFRLYRGATPTEPVAEMFSFAPCLPAAGVEPGTRFARPTIDIPGVITPVLKQGKRFTFPDGLDQASLLWKRVVEQVEQVGLALATRIEVPARRGTWREADGRDLDQRSEAGIDGAPEARLPDAAGSSSTGRRC